MKKLLLITLCCICLCGCGNESVEEAPKDKDNINNDQKLMYECTLEDEHYLTHLDNIYIWTSGNKIIKEVKYESYDCFGAIDDNYSCDAISYLLQEFEQSGIKLSYNEKDVGSSRGTGLKNSYIRAARDKRALSYIIIDSNFSNTINQELNRLENENYTCEKLDKDLNKVCCSVSNGVYEDGKCLDSGATFYSEEAYNFCINEG